MRSISGFLDVFGGPDHATVVRGVRERVRWACRDYQLQDEQDDVEQEAYVRLLRDLPSEERTQLLKPRAWMDGVIRHCCLDHIRRRRPLERAAAIARNRRSFDPGCAESVSARELLIALMNAAKLERSERRLIVLHLRGKSCREIALALRRTEGAVRTAWYRVCQKLRTLGSDATSPSPV